METGNYTNHSVAQVKIVQNYSSPIVTEDYVIVVNGYVVPFLAIVILFTNVVAIAVFKRQKTYGASQACLVGIAVSDTMTMVFPAPFYFYQYALGCTIGCGAIEVATWISLYLPTITHTASIWLTMVLAGQRYLFVCHPFRARSWCTLRYTTITIILTYIMSVVMHVSRFFVMIRHDTGQGCTLVYREDISAEVYLITYLILRVIFIQFVPCVCLTVFNTIMLLGLREVSNKKMELHNNTDNNLTAVTENTRVTIMIVCMAAITLLVELPGGIIISLYIANYYLGYEIADYGHLRSSEIIVNLLIMLSYPLNFLLYCSMSTEFKQTLGGIFSQVKCKLCGLKRKHRKRYRNQESQANASLIEEETTLIRTVTETCIRQ